MLFFLVCLSMSNLFSKAEKAASVCGELKPEAMKNHKLECSQIMFLNAALQNQPIVVARIKLAYRRACQLYEKLFSVQKKPVEVHQSIDKSVEIHQHVDAAFIHDQLFKMLEPVEDFFKEIREHSMLVKPLLQESLSYRNISIQQSLLMKFIDSNLTPQETILTFFEKIIRTQDDLKLFCIEFKALFGDINESMSIEVKQNFDKFVKSKSTNDYKKKLNQ